MIERLMMALIALVLLAPLPSCNTIDGMGQDISQAGRAISNSADDTQKELRH